MLPNANQTNEHICSPLLAESEVALIGILTFITMGVKKLIEEGDSIRLS